MNRITGLARRSRALAAASVLVGAAVVTIGVGLAWASHDSGRTMHVCVNNAGVVRQADTCRSSERAYVLVTEAGLAAVRAALEAADAANGARIDALEAADTAIGARLDGLASADVATDGRLDDLEAADVATDARLDALEAADQALGERLDALESRVAALEAAAAPAEVTFTKIFDGGHYASYTVTGSGFLAGSTVTSGVGTTATVAADGTFSVFGGNLFCAAEVSVTGTAADGSSVTRSAPVECNSEATSPAAVTFTKIFDGGHYASYTVTGSGFFPGSTVTSGVGTTETVAADGTFSVFGGNLFCDAEVSVTGTDANGDPITRSAPVECDSE